MTEVAAFVQKHRDDLRAVQSAAEFAQTMRGSSVAIRVRPTEPRGF